MEIEEDFTQQAKASGLSEEEAKNAYNQNMLHGGLLAEGAAEFARQYNRRWLLTAYEAGDVVFHNSYAVRHPLELTIWARADFLIKDTRLHYKSRPAK